MKAVLKLYNKKVLENGLIIDMKIWEVKDKNYTGNFKYRLIATYDSSHVRVLMDNHRPKGHHYHINQEEFPYTFQSLDQLILDFKDLVKKHLGVNI